MLSVRILGDFVVSGSTDEKIKLWSVGGVGNATDGECIGTVDHGAPVQGVALAANGAVVGVSRIGSQLRVWRQKKGAELIHSAPTSPKSVMRGAAAAAVFLATASATTASAGAAARAAAGEGPTAGATEKIAQKAVAGIKAADGAKTAALRIKQAAAAPASKESTLESPKDTGTTTSPKNSTGSPASAEQTELRHMTTIQLRAILKNAGAPFRYTDKQAELIEKVKAVRSANLFAKR